MTALPSEENKVEPVRLDRILHNCHPIDVIVCSPVSTGFNGTATKSLCFLLTSPKRGVFLINCIFAFQRRYRRIFLNQCFQNGKKCDVSQLAEMSNKLCELTMDLIRQNLDNYAGLSTLIIDMGIAARIPIPWDEPPDELLKSLHVNFDKWSKIVHAVAEQAAPGLQNLLILDSSTQAVDDSTKPTKTSFPAQLYQNLHIDRMLVKMPSLRTLYLPNLLRYEQECKNAWKAVRDLPLEKRFAGIERLVLPTTTVEDLHACKMLPEIPEFSGQLEMHFDKTAASKDEKPKSPAQQLAGTAFQSNKLHAMILDNFNSGFATGRGKFDLYEPPTDDTTPEQVKLDLNKFALDMSDKLNDERRMQSVWFETTTSSKNLLLLHILVHLHGIYYRLQLFDLQYFKNLLDALLTRQQIKNSIVFDFDAVGQPYEMAVAFTILLQIFHEQPNRFENLFHNITIRLTANEPDKEVSWMFDGMRKEDPGLPELMKGKLDLKTFGFFPPTKLVLMDIMEQWEQWKKDGEVEAVDMNVVKERVLSAFKALIADAMETKKQLQNQTNEKAFEYGLRSMLYGRMTTFEYRIQTFQEMEHDDDATWTYADELRQIEEQLMYEALFYDKQPATGDFSYAEAAELFLMSVNDDVIDEKRPFPMLKKVKVRFDRAQVM